MNGTDPNPITPVADDTANPPAGAPAPDGAQPLSAPQGVSVLTPDQRARVAALTKPDVDRQLGGDGDHSDYHRTMHSILATIASSLVHGAEKPLRVVGGGLRNFAANSPAYQARLAAQRQAQMEQQQMQIGQRKQSLEEQKFRSEDQERNLRAHMMSVQAVTMQAHLDDYLQGERDAAEKLMESDIEAITNTVKKPDGSPLSVTEARQFMTEHAGIHELTASDAKNIGAGQDQSTLFAKPDGGYLKVRTSLLDQPLIAGSQIATGIAWNPKTESFDITYQTAHEGTTLRDVLFQNSIIKKNFIEQTSARINQEKEEKRQADTEAQKALAKKRLQPSATKTSLLTPEQRKAKLTYDAEYRDAAKEETLAQQRGDIPGVEAAQKRKNDALAAYKEALGANKAGGGLDQKTQQVVGIVKGLPPDQQRAQIEGAQSLTPDEKAAAKKALNLR